MSVVDQEQKTTNGNQQKACLEASKSPTVFTTALRALICPTVLVGLMPNVPATTNILIFNGVPHTWLGPKNIIFGHKILKKPSHDCSYQPMGGRPSGALLDTTEGKLKSPFEAPGITEHPRRHGSSARYIRDPMTQGYRPGGACRSCGTIPRKSSRSPGLFLVVSHCAIWTTVITLQTPPVTHGPRASSVQVDCPIAACAFA